jgi:hypothetical protein
LKTSRASGPHHRISSALMRIDAMMRARMHCRMHCRINASRPDAADAGKDSNVSRQVSNKHIWYGI